VHAVLRRLEAAGFDGAPGIDEHGREVLIYIDGKSIDSRQPLRWAAQLIRRFHDTIAGPRACGRGGASRARSARAELVVVVVPSKRPVDARFRMQHPLGVVVNQPSVWPDDDFAAPCGSVRRIPTDGRLTPCGN
jgi:hypothetical protein